MAGVAATCSPMLECNGFGSIQPQRGGQIKAMASVNVSRMKTGTSMEALIQKGCKTSVSISKSRATATYAVKQESAFENKESGEAASTNLVVKEDPLPGFGHLWTQCNSCYGLNYKKHLTTKMFICEHCNEYLKMSSSDRIDFLIESSSWTPRDEDMIFVDTYGFESQSKAATK